MTNTVGDINFLGASGTGAKDLCQMRRTTTLSLTKGVWTAVPLDAEDFDAANGHSTVTNTHRYTAAAAGKYRLSGAIGFTQSTTTTTVAGQFRKNATATTGTTGAITGSYAVTNVSGTIQTLVLPTCYVSLAAGDWVDMIAYNGNDTPAIDNAYSCIFTVEWVGA